MYTLKDTEPGTVVAPPSVPIVKQKAFWIGLASGLISGIGGWVLGDYLIAYRRRRSR